MTKILFVCLGNICRSPMAEGVFARLVAERGLMPPVEVDSAGTGSWHIGKPPDDRAQAAAARRGADISGLRARQVAAADFDRFDLVIAMDGANVDALHQAAPPHSTHKIRRFLEFAPQISVMEVPDPYYGGEDGFDHALDLIEAASAGLADYINSPSG